MKNFVRAIIFSFLVLLISNTSLAQAAESASSIHFTLIINQVRGPECCEPGDIRWFKEQQSYLKSHHLVGSFAMRYDAIQNDKYTAAALSDPNNEYGALFEITPQLTKDAGVIYNGDPAHWYEAQNVYLIGYEQADRKKIIDTYMALFKKKFGKYPKFSSAWMIDAWSLGYLRSQYGVLAHQLTREQFGTDSYTLYGGPVHYPYFPSFNWAMIPQPNNQAMPLILRQTISDPVQNYGDKTNSFTSQPNDYFLRKDNLSYFLHLFKQAHAQNNPYTIAVLGLENTMAEPAQLEFESQLQEVKKWQDSSPLNTTMRASEFAQWYAEHQLDITSYGGASSKDQTEKAWFINTPKYRARIRLSNGELAVTDLRLYDPKFTDPYMQTTAKNLGWWIVPFVLDSSRYRQQDSNGMSVQNDSRKNLSPKTTLPMTIPLQTNVKQADLVSNELGKVLQAGTKDVAIFTAEGIQLAATPDISRLQNLPKVLRSLAWNQESSGTPDWGFSGDNSQRTPFVHTTDLAQLRETFRSYLFPEKRVEEVDLKKTFLHVNNQYAIAGRNPIRLILFPKNSSGDAVLISNNPSVITSNAVDDIKIQAQPQADNSVLIELTNAQPMQTTVEVKLQKYTQTVTVYFAPNCKQNTAYCLQHPMQGFWYLRNLWDDYRRARKEKSSI